jgi:hypothetical protein
LKCHKRGVGDVFEGIPSLRAKDIGVWSPM